jgi:uracil-DNA glycosylase family 4
LPPALDPAFREALAARLRFYRDLGLTEFYRRTVDPASLDALETPVEPATLPLAALTAQEATPGHDLPGEPETAAQVSDISALDTSLLQNSDLSENEAIPPRKPFPAPPAIAPAIKTADKAAALRVIQEDLGDCTRCALHKGRNKIVFADGSPNARLMFIGEGPGADEDAQGLPFVGRAGQLLNNMIAAMGLKREEVYIANVVKCRPPGNRTPEPDEANTCSPFLFRQIDVVRPEVIVALGATAATYLLGQRQPLAGLRGRVHAFRSSKLIVTYHPAFLLRDPRQKKEAWADLQIAMRELGLKVPGRA